MIANSVEAAINPANKLTFLLDWELTLKCNLDCSYCTTGLYGGHDNSTEHPPVDECLAALDFMYQYVDIYMKHKPAHSKHVVLNVYGGESLFHPDIEQLLIAARKKHEVYRDSWTLAITTTTNAIVGPRRMDQIIDLIDEFTVSYHTENLPKQREQFKNNLLNIKAKGKRVKCVVLMHPDNFQDNLDMIEFCRVNDIRHLPRQLDSGPRDFNYKAEQVIWFDKLYKSKSKAEQVLELPKTSCDTDLSDVGRACCGGRQLVQNQNFSQQNFYVENKFPDWYCSVNWFFLYVKQVNGEIFVNKDCKMNFQGQVAPIGNLANYQELLDDVKHKLSTNTLPVIQCKKAQCLCGLCAPKAKELDTYTAIMQKYKIKDNHHE